MAGKTRIYESKVDNDVNYDDKWAVGRLGLSDDELSGGCMIIGSFSKSCFSSRRMFKCACTCSYR